MAAVGATITFDPNLAKLLTYILLFMADFTDPEMPELRQVMACQETMIQMLQR